MILAGIVTDPRFLGVSDSLRTSSSAHNRRIMLARNTSFRPLVLVLLAVLLSLAVRAASPITEFTYLWTQWTHSGLHISFPSFEQAYKNGELNLNGAVGPL